MATTFGVVAAGRLHRLSRGRHGRDPPHDEGADRRRPVRHGRRSNGAAPRRGRDRQPVRPRRGPRYRRQPVRAAGVLGEVRRRRPAVVLERDRAPQGRAGRRACVPASGERRARSASPCARPRRRRQAGHERHRPRTRRPLPLRRRVRACRHRGRRPGARAGDPLDIRRDLDAAGAGPHAPRAHVRPRPRLCARGHRRARRRRPLGDRAVVALPDRAGREGRARPWHPRRLDGARARRRGARRHLLLQTAFASWRAARPRPEGVPGGTSPIARFLTGIGAPISAVMGSRLALEPGRGKRALPTRPALAAALVGLLGVAAATALASGISRRGRALVALRRELGPRGQLPRRQRPRPSVPGDDRRPTDQR